MPTLDFKYFIFPFLAHALGTLVGAIIAGWIATTNKMKFSISIGILFLLGGIYMSFMIKGPIWFTSIDLVFAYIPMALLGGKIAKKLSKK
jgi:ABC-type Mn2+/Zn2+ transport system permease subunit